FIVTSLRRHIEQDPLRAVPLRAPDNFRRVDAPDAGYEVACCARTRTGVSGCAVFKWGASLNRDVWSARPRRIGFESLNVIVRKDDGDIVDRAAGQRPLHEEIALLGLRPS